MMAGKSGKARRAKPGFFATLAEKVRAWSKKCRQARIDTGIPAPSHLNRNSVPANDAKCFKTLNIRTAGKDES
ncbi:hypothetical protein NKH36_18360 [Mesorhizobium sp. M1312]|uniref:hypothetical protein n=1 Tax=unclassified Mesorhizobium TaxID=325217 RepID=UPI003335EED6